MHSENQTSLKVVSSKQKVDAKKTLPKSVSAVFEYTQETIAPLLNTTLSKFDDALFDYANKSEGGEKQDSYFHALRELRLHRKKMETAFRHALVIKFVRLKTIPSSAQKKVISVEPAFPSELSLVSNDKLDIVLSKESIVRKVNETSAAKLEALLSCFGQALKKSLDAADMPLGPESLTECFSQSVSELDIETRCSLILFKLFDLHVVGRMGEIYAASLAIFNAQGLTPAVTPKTSHIAEHVIDVAPATYSPPVAHRNAAASGSGVASGPAFASSGARQCDSGYGLGASVPTAAQVSHSSAAVSGADGALSIGQLMPALNYIGKHATHGKLTNHEYFLRSVGRVLEKRGHTQGLSPAQSNELVLMSQTFAEMTCKSELAESTRQLLTGLLVPFSKAVMVEPEYLADKASDGRALLNILSNLDFYWHNDQDHRYLHQAKSVLDKLNASAGEPKSSIKNAVEELNKISHQQALRIEQLEKRLVAAEEGKAKADHVKTHVVKQISAVTNHKQIPPEINDIIQNAWRQVMFFDGLKYGLGSLKWRMDVKILFRLARLSYFAKHDINRIRRTRYHAKVVEQVSSGLKSIGFHAFKLDKVVTVLKRFLSKLEVENLRSLTEKNVTKNSAAQEGTPTVRAVALKPIPITESRYQAPTDPMLMPALRQIDGFQRGQWFNMLTGGQRKRCRLAAIIAQTGTFIFVNGSGAKVSELSTEKLARDLLNQNIQPVPCENLFENILEKLIAQRPRLLDANAM